MKTLYALVDTYSNQVVSVRRMTHGEAMLDNLLNATPYAFWTVTPYHFVNV
jgi:hypothetical protein